MKRILIVEDDKLIAELERDYLEAAEFEVEIAADGTKGLFLARNREYALILLDIMLPGISGFEVCREIRKERNIPVIMVTAKKEDFDKIRGLGLGADDYVIKPFSPSELVARVKSHIQIHEMLLGSGKTDSERDANMEIHDLKICPLSRRVYLQQKEIALTNKEYELLWFLASNPNIVFSKETLFDRVWGLDAAGDTSTVTVHINRIREKIEKDTNNPEYIETVWGAGYRFAVL